MPVYSGAHSAKGGFNQSGGSMLMVLTSLESTPATAVYTYTISTASTGSGGATTAPVLTLTKMGDILKAGATYAALTDAEAAAFVDAGKLLKDMGETIVSAGRTFRKVQVAATGAAFVDSRGVVGNAAAAPNNGYGSFYIDVTRNSAASAAPAPVLRYC